MTGSQRLQSNCSWTPGLLISWEYLEQNLINFQISQPYISFDKSALSIRQGNHGSRWISDDLEVRDRQVTIVGKSSTLFSFSLLIAGRLRSQSWFRWRIICTWICRICIHRHAYINIYLWSSDVKTFVCASTFQPGPNLFTFGWVLESYLPAYPLLPFCTETWSLGQ